MNRANATTILCTFFVFLVALSGGSCKSKEDKIAEVLELLNHEKYSEGIALYQELESVQDTTLLNKLASLYAEGTGVKQDSAIALQLWATSADLGNPSAAIKVGNAFDDAQGGYKKDLKKAFEYYEKAAEKNYPEGLRKTALFYLYEYGDGIVERNPEKGIEMLKKAVAADYVPAMRYLGYVYENGKGVLVDMDEAIKYFQMAADRNDMDALDELGIIYDNGYGVKKDHRKAFEYFLKAADMGYHYSQYSVAYDYEKGIGVEKDAKKAVEWYLKAANQGNDEAMCNLGYMYENGQGVEQNWQKAVEMYRQAAEKGYDVAQYNLASCYYNGWGVKKNMKEAAKWYKKAAGQGNENARKKLGIMAIQGQL